MNGTLVAVVPLAELVAEVYDEWLHSRGLSSLKDVLTEELLMEEISFIARVAVHCRHIFIYKYLMRTRDLFARFIECSEERVSELADELYMKVRDELPADIAKYKHIYAVDNRAGTLYIHLLVTCEAMAYGIDPQSLIDQVI